MPERPPSFQFYPKDWLDHKVTRLSYEAQGVYIRLLCLMWKDSADQSSIIDDPVDIARSCGLSARKWKSLRSIFQKPGVELFLEVASAQGKPPRLVSERLKREVKRQKEFRKQRSAAGKLGAKRRWHGKANGSANGKAIATPMANDSSSSSSSSSVVPLLPRSRGGWPNLLQEAIEWFHGPTPTRKQEDRLADLLKGFGDDLAGYALHECKVGKNKSVAYFEAILKRRFSEGQEPKPEKPQRWQSGLQGKTEFYTPGSGEVQGGGDDE